MRALRFALAGLLMAVPLLSKVEVQPMAESAPGLELRLEARIDELGERLEWLADALDRACERPPYGTMVGSVEASRESLDRLLRLQRRLAAWNRAGAEDRWVRTEIQQLALLHRLDAERRELLAELTESPGAPVDEGLRRVRPRNGGSGFFSGTVTAEGSGAPLPGVAIDIFDVSGVHLGTAVTAGDGSYTSPGLSAGSFFAYTVELSSGYVNELFEDIPCSWICDVTAGTPIVVTDATETPGIDFVLALGGRISGTVQDDDTTSALSDVFVDLFDAGGSWVANPVTDSSGVFLSPGLAAGSYYATTFNLAQYLDELYADQSCPFGCDPTAGTAITVAVGATTSGIDFGLVRGGWITGDVTQQGSGTPLSGVWVRIHDAAGNAATDGQTDVSGSFISSRGLPAGSYFVRTDNALGYLDELYEDKSCVGSCDVTDGDAISVALGTATAGIDFTLALGGSIAGTVTEEGTGLPIAGVYVDLFDGAGQFLTSDLTDGAGAYEIETGLAPGDYYARTVSPAPWVDELYDGQSCATWCTVTDGTAIAVVGTATTSGIDFVLGRGGQVAGRVTAEGGGPLEGVWVDVFDSQGGHVANGATDAAGAWRTGGTLPPGSYFVRTWNDLGFVDELFEDLPCPGSACEVAGGRDVEVFSTATTVGVDFELSPGTVLTGTVRERGVAVPIEGVAVEIWNESGSWTGFDTTDTLGAYRLPAMPAGRYFLKTWNELGYVDQLHEEIPCLGCVARGGEAVTVPGADAVDFDLDRGGRITGVVTEDLGGAPIAEAHVELWSATGRLLWWTATDSSGDYALERLPAGGYYLKTWNDQGWVDEIWNDRQCAACDATEGTPVVVMTGETTSDVDFALVSGGAISGTVTIDEQAIVDRIRVRVHDADGWLVRAQLVSGDGSYTVDRLPGGSYWVRTANGAGYVNEVWDDVPCIGDCDPEVGTAVTVAAGVTSSGIDFELEPGARIAGTVTESSTGLPIDDARVGIYDTSGTRLLTTRTGSDGHFRTWGSVPAGTYHAATENFAGFYDELYSGIPCVGGGDFCDVTIGTAFTVAAGSVLEGVDFTLSRGGGWLEGSVFDALWAHPLSGADVEIFDAVGDPVSRVVWESPSDGTGRFTSSGLVPGTYYARADTTSLRVPYADQLFEELSCEGACDPTSGTPIVVAAAAATTGVDFRLGPRDPTIFSDDFESGTADAWSASVGLLP